jgi:hypothetical protein
VLLRREGIVLSVSMVGRILDRLRATGELGEPRRRPIRARHRGVAPSPRGALSRLAAWPSTGATLCRSTRSLCDRPA